MNRWRAALAAALVAVGAMAAPLAGPARANHDEAELWVTVAINAAGGDRLAVTDATFDTTSYVELGSEVAVALDRAPGSYRSTEDFEGADVVLDDRLAQPDAEGRLSYAIDTGKLQVLAQRRGYEAILFEVCTPRVRQIVDSLVAPQPVPTPSPNRCRGWYQPVEDPPVRAVLQLDPDRQRYPAAVRQAVGAAAIAFALLGIGATMLRRGPLGRRSLGSWLLATGSALVVAPIGWTVATFLLWWTGAATDPMLLGGGSVGEQVARTTLPGLVFLLPALLPAAVLLSVPRKDPPAPPSSPPPLDPTTTWWPAPWWAQWAAQRRLPAPPPPLSVPGSGPPAQGWAAPGSTDG